MRHRLVEEFVVGYYNGSIKPNLAEKNPTTGRDAEFLMDGPQFDRTKKPDIWSFSNAVGTGYQYRVTYRDRRFSDLDRLLEMYSAGSATEQGGQPSAEERLYRLILLLMKERRLPQTFKVQPAKDSQVESLASTVERLARSMDDLEKRLKRLEDAQTPRPDSGAQSQTPLVP